MDRDVKFQRAATRRQLLIRTLATGAAVAGGAALAACTRPSDQVTVPSKVLPPPETTSVRIVNPPACEPGIWLAKDYLRDEGFTDVSFIATPFTSRDWITKNLGDIACAHPEFAVGTIDAGLPLVLLAGLHSGCLEVWVREGITSVRDLRGTRISVRTKDLSDQFFAFFATLLGWVGIDPLKDVQFVEAGAGNVPGMIAAFVEGRADVLLAGAQGGPMLRRLATSPGHVMLETLTEKPWSEYYCCHVAANRDWARKYPVATKRVTRALLLATDAAAKDMPRAAHDAAGPMKVEESLVVETMGMCAYNWRDLEPDDTLRFFALRLAQARMITSTPQKLIAQGTDFAFMRQLRNELKP